MESKQLIKYAVENGFEVTVEERKDSTSFIWADGSHCIVADKEEARELVALLVKDVTLAETIKRLFGGNWVTKNKKILSLMNTPIHKVEKHGKRGRLTFTIWMDAKTQIEVTQKLTGIWWARIPQY